MTAIDGIQRPYAPTLQHQLPDSVCKITTGGHTYVLGAESCTAYAFASFVDRATMGRAKPSGCSLRRMTDPLDVTGGLTLSQIAEVVRDRYGIVVSVYVGSSVVTPAYLARQIRAGRPTVVQGNTSAYLGTRYKVTDGDVNHAEAWLEVRGGTLDVPADVLVYDPCADGRRADIDTGPTWVPWPIALRFCAYLRPNGAGTARLGPGKVYCAVGPDTEPHVSLVSGGVQATPFPDRARANLTRTPIHNARKRGKPTTTRYLPKGRLVRLYQYARGETWKGSPWWGGNDDGTEWVHLANLRHVKGPT